MAKKFLVTSCHILEWLVTGQVIPINPAAMVRSTGIAYSRTMLNAPAQMDGSAVTAHVQRVRLQPAADVPDQVVFAADDVKPLLRSFEAARTVIDSFAR